MTAGAPMGGVPEMSEQEAMAMAMAMGGQMPPDAGGPPLDPSMMPPGLGAPPMGDPMMDPMLGGGLPADPMLDTPPLPPVPGGVGYPSLDPASFLAAAEQVMAADREQFAADQQAAMSAAASQLGGGMGAPALAPELPGGDLGLPPLPGDPTDPNVDLGLDPSITPVGGVDMGGLPTGDISQLPGGVLDEFDE